MAYEHFVSELREFIETSIERMKNPDRNEKLKRLKEKREEKKKKVATKYGF